MPDAELKTITLNPSWSTLFKMYFSTGMIAGTTDEADKAFREEFKKPCEIVDLLNEFSKTVPDMTLAEFMASDHVFNIIKS